ncbi:MAG: DUF1579 domain-containing protein [Gemmataceae bacterium]|nr:DUF1579 domain-containing protein [Gemmataceae bacterium]
MHAEPQKEHHWLDKLVGDWTFESECSMGPDQPPGKFAGMETVRSLGGLWVLCEGKGEMPGGGMATTLMTLGYDPVKKKYIGSFIGSMMTHLWIYEGGLDAAAKVLTLDTLGPSFTDPGKMIEYQDIVEFQTDDYRTLSSQTRGDDGQWNRFMTAHYRRKK